MIHKYEVSLTNEIVASLPPGKAEYCVFDNRVPQLAVRVQPHGASSWVIRGRWNGKPLRVTLGSARQMVVEEARRETEHLLRTGLRPPKAKPATPTFEEFEQVYNDRKVAPRKAINRENYQRRMASRIMPAFRHRPIGEITQPEVTNWFFAYGEKFPGGANWVLGALRAILNAAVAWGVLDDQHPNPCTGIRKFPRPPRGRVINSEGLGRLGATLESVRGRMPDVVDIVRLLALTGCRHGEIVGLHWDEVRTDRLALTASKTGPKTVLIGDSASLIFESRRRVAHSRFVFPSRNNPDKPRGDIRDAWKSIRRKADLEKDVRVHDLRHTFATHSVTSGESLFLTGALLGHRRPESTARYAHLQNDQLFSAAERIAGTINEWLEGPAQS